MLDARRRLFLKQSLAGAAAVSLTPSVFAAPYRPGRALRVALVGCGRQGRELIKELAKFEDVTIAAVADPVESRRSSGARRAGDAAAYADVDALLAAESDLDAVFVASSTHTHRAIVEACAAKGLAIYCEAPLAHTAEDARAIAKAAGASAGVFQSGLLARVNPIYKLANKFYRSGSIRDAVSMRGTWHKKTSWRASNNAELLDWKVDPAVSLGLPGEVGTHQFDAVSWFTNKAVKSVRGHGSIRLHEDGRTMADTIGCELDFGDGLFMSYEASLANSFESSYETIRGTMGTMKLAWTAGWLFKEADASTQGWEVYANRQQFHDEEGITLIADATKLAAQDRLKDGVGLPHPPLYYGVETFLASVTDGAEVACTAADGLTSTLVGIAAAKAVASGETVVVEGA